MSEIKVKISIEYRTDEHITSETLRNLENNLTVEIEDLVKRFARQMEWNLTRKMISNNTIMSKIRVRILMEYKTDEYITSETLKDLENDLTVEIEDLVERFARQMGWNLIRIIILIEPY